MVIVGALCTKEFVVGICWNHEIPKCPCILQASGHLKHKNSHSHKGDFETTTLSTTFRFAHDLESSKLEQGSSFNSFKTFPDPLDGMLHKNL